jgi:hypothetical protein
VNGPSNFLVELIRYFETFLTQDLISHICGQICGHNYHEIQVSLIA